VLLLVAVVLANAYPETYYQNQFSQFSQNFNKTYATPEEQALRYTVFKSNLDYINEHNARPSTFWLGVNQFADMTNKEYQKFLNFKASKGTFLSMVPSSHSGDLPKTIDWREKGAVSYVKDQGQCGSCWAFSTTGTLEGTLKTSTNKLIELSEQQIIDCSWDKPYNNEGCDGGDMRPAIQAIIDMGGIDTEDDYPYDDYYGGDRHKCRYDQNKKVNLKIRAMVNISEGNETDLAYGIVQSPVSVAIDASQSSFQFYVGGIYYEPSCKTKNEDLDHGVLAVGFGDGYFLVKNSWGPTWGWQGYIYMTRGKHNNCGIATYATYTVV